MGNSYMNKKWTKIDNLLLCDNIEHKSLHCEMERLGFDLMRMGYIYFDKNNRHYYLNMETRTED